MLDIMSSGVVKLRVGEILRERGIGIDQFAQMTGLHYRTALDIAKNRYERIGMDTIAAICKALEITPAELFDYNPDANLRIQ